MYLTTPTALIHLISKFGITLCTLIGGLLGSLISLIFLKIYSESKLKFKYRMMIAISFFFPSSLLSISFVDVLLNSSQFSDPERDKHIEMIYNFCFWTVSLFGW